MSGVEVAAAVMGIIAAFATGADQLTKYRDRHKAKKAAKAKAKQEKEEAAKEKEREKLDQSLVLGRQEVRKEYDTDLARLGPEFQKGDEIGVSQLKDQLIRLQNTVISVLGHALNSSGGVEDTVAKGLGDLLRASEGARKGSVRALKDQYQRMSVKKPLRGALKGRPKALCRYYNTPNGCRYGDQCWFAHVTTDSNSDSESDESDDTDSSTNNPSKPEYEYKSYSGTHSSDDFCPFALDLQKDPSIPLPGRFCPAIGCWFSWDESEPTDFKPHFTVSKRWYFKQHLYQPRASGLGNRRFRCRWCVERWDKSLMTRLLESCPKAYGEVQRFKEHVWDHDHGIFRGEREIEKMG